MNVVEARNVEEALRLGLALLRAQGRRRGSRNGDVVVMDGPVTTVYRRPRERVLVSPARDANPFFHLYEALWMLGGRRDVASLTHYVRRMADFSDDGQTFHGAYGHRWRVYFRTDQLATIANRLRTMPDDRRCVLQMWDARGDLNRSGRDVPCNTQAYLWRSYTGELDMTVLCRSNDIIWGAYGANAVHFSVLQEYVAAMVGCPTGTLWQVSNNFHAYVDVMERSLPVLDEPDSGLYSGEPNLYPLVSGEVNDFDRGLRALLAGTPIPGSADAFFHNVAAPLRDAYALYREGNLASAATRARQCAAADWRRAAMEWLERRSR